MKLVKQNKSKSEISTASLPDIIFMLLIFFMVTTVIKKYDGIAVTQPKAEQLKKVKNKKDLSYIWVTKDGIVSINDRIMNIEDIENIASLIMENNNNTTFLLKIDEESLMEIIHGVQGELRKALALKIIYDTKTKKRQGQIS